METSSELTLTIRTAVPFFRVMSSKPTATIPDARARMDFRLVDAPHPAVIDVATLSNQCDLRTQARSGPGGQHRNKTSSGVFLTHRPTGIVAEATERRSQAQNRDVALQRLRYLLATEIRTLSPLDPVCSNDDPLESDLRQRYHRHSFRLSDANIDKPGVLALVMNDLWVAGGQPSLVATQWGVSTSKIVALLRSFAPALIMVNRVRSHHERLPLH